MNFNDEEKLCVLFSRLTLRAADQEYIKKILEKEIDWEYFITLSNHHRIMPLIYWHAKDLFSNYFSPHILKQFHSSFQNHLKRNSLLFADLKKLIEFSKGKYDIILLKGSYLANTIYPNIALRPMSDVDILIERTNLKRTEMILSHINFKREDVLELIHKKPVPKWNRFKELDDSGHLAFFKIADLPYKNNLCIEAHVNIFKKINYSFSDLTELFRSQAISFQFDDVKSRTLSDEHHFIYMCCHIFYNAIDLWANYKNTAFKLLHFCDIREFLIKYKISLDLSAYPNSISEAVAYVLKIINLIFGDKFFPEKIDYGKYKHEDIPNQLFWKIGEQAYSENIATNIKQRIFSLSPLPEALKLYPEINEKQNSLFFKKLSKIESFFSGKIKSCTK